MARIITEINDLQLVRVPFERDEHSIGDLALHPRVVQRYIEAGYADQPKSKDQAKERDVKGWNGLNTSLVNHQIYSERNQNVVAVTLAPTRYLFRQAMEDLVRQEILTSEEILQMSPNLTGSSLLVVGRYNYSPVLIAQLKGDALGSGEIHGALAAGGMPGHFVTDTKKYVDPVSACLKKEAVEEVGTSFESHGKRPYLLVGEEETGQCSIANLLLGVLPLEDVLDAYQESVTASLKVDGDKKRLEVAGIAVLPLERTLFTIRDSKRVLAGITCYTPKGDGTLERTIQDRGMRPYTQGVLNYLYQKSQNLTKMLDAIGF